jgi:alkylation response protein AidB-like acyl-CoA dehydrogenase
VNFALTDEQIQLREVLRRYLAERSPVDVCRRSLEDGPDPRLWSAMAQEMGVAGALVPEAQGGQGFGCVEMSILMSEIGRVLNPGPVLPVAILAARLLAGVGDQRYLPDLIDGRVVVLAAAEAPGGWDHTVWTTTFDAAAGTVTGSKIMVEWADAATGFFVLAGRPSASGEEGIVLAYVAADAAGVSVHREDGIDPSRHGCRVTFDAAAAPLVAKDVRSLLPEALDVARVAVASEMVGSMDRILELIIDHCSSRVQFGVPLSDFQVIRHRCAELLAELELTRSATLAAACELDAGDRATAAQAASIALATTAEAAAHFSREVVQLHGGIGFTWEHDAHLFVRRLQSNRQSLGAPAGELQRIWALVADGAE